VALSLLLAVGLSRSAVAVETFTTTQLTYNNFYDLAPQVSGDRVAWYGGLNAALHEIFTWKVGDASPTQLTTNAYQDKDPQVSGDRVVWLAQKGGTNWDVYTWKYGDAAPTDLSDDGIDDYTPQVSGDWVVWQSSDGDQEIYLWAGTGSPINISNNTDLDLNPQVSGNRVVWQGTGGTAPDTTDYEIWTWKEGDGAPTQLTTNNYDDLMPQVSGNRVVWQAATGPWSQIFTQLVGSGAIQLTNTPGPKIYPQVSDDRVVWQGTGGTGTFTTDYEIFTWKVGDLVNTQLTENDYDDNTPQVSGDRVAWQYEDLSGPGSDIFTWKLGAGTTRLTNNVVGDFAPQVSGDRVVWQGWDSSGAGEYEIFTAVPAPPVVRPVVCYQQTDSRLIYAGSWYNSTASGASGGSYRYANSSGASVELSFNGTGLALFAKKSPSYGLAKVTLDGGTPAYVDLYSSSTLYQQNVYGTGTLDNIDHTLKIEWGGAKNAASSGYIVNVDAIFVAGTLNTPIAPPAGPAFFQQTDSRLGYAGSWFNATASAASGGSYRYANSPGSSVTATFSGTGLALFAKKSPAYGMAKVTLDGGSAVYVDLYSPSTLYQQNVYGTGTLADGNHTLVIEWAGAKNVSSSGYIVNVDAFFVAGTLIQGPGLVCYQQTDSHFAYSGAWYSAAAGAASGGSYAYANSSGASTTVSFHGTGLALFAKKSPSYGVATVSLDGGSPVYVDLYSPSTLYLQNVYGTGPLTDGNHTVVIKWDGSKNASSSGYLIDVDAAYVQNTL
jgi:hypothetical protein